MSTILKTLKKLEEEKSVLDKGLDLKELVLQDEEISFSHSFSETPRKFFLIGGLLFMGVGVGLFWAFQGGLAEKQVARVSPPVMVYSQQPAPVQKQYSTPVPGIPLSNIPEQPLPQFYQEPLIKNNFYAIEKKSPERIPERIIEPVKPPSDFARSGIQQKQEREIYEIQSLIASAKSLADEPEEFFIPQFNNRLSIPGLKVKGIIFFSSGSSSNHIFVATKNSNNHKMRVGDSIDAATLMKIESTGAVFAYQGQTAFLNIGH